MRVVLRACVALPLCAAVACAHAHAETASLHDASRWTWDPWIVAPLALALLLYALGLLRLTHRTAPGHGLRAGYTAAYACGWIALAGALLSPLHWYGERLFSMHMIEHEIVMAVAAPLLVLARPAGVLLWALPRRARLGAGAAWRSESVQTMWRHVAAPASATLLHGLAIWFWHVPAAFDAAVATTSLHRLQHLCFLSTALLFWWAMLRRSARGPAMWHLFITMLHTGILGALMTLAPRVLYRLQTQAAPAFGLTALEDQQLAGVIMWVPAGTVYAGAALVLAALWIRGAGPAPGTPLAAQRSGA